MNKVRLKLTPSQKPDGTVHLKLEWVEVDEAERIVAVLASEEFAVSADRLGSVSYVSRAEFPEGDLRAGTFWLDAEGRRHFFVSAEPGEVGLLGAPVGMRKE